MGKDLKKDRLYVKKKLIFSTEHDNSLPCLSAKRKFRGKGERERNKTE